MVFTKADFLTFNPVYGVIICKHCQHALVPDTVKSHLQAHYKKDEVCLTESQIRDLCRRARACPAASPESVKALQVPRDTAPVPFLRLYEDAFCCRLCPATRPYVSPVERVLVAHLRKEHQWSRPRGAQAAIAKLARGLHTVAIFPITCQTFFQYSPLIRYFPVQAAPIDLTAGSREELGSSVQALSILEQVELQLSRKLSAPDPAPASQPGPRHFSQASPWLDTTQWARYLRGHDLQRAACLTEIPSPPVVQ